MCVRKVRCARKHDAELRPLASEAGDREPAEPHAMVTALAPDQPLAMTLAARPVIGERHLQGGVDRLGAGSGKEDVIKSFRRDLHHLIGVVKRKRMAEREARSVAELARLVANARDA